MEFVAHFIIITGLIIGSITDMRTREVPDWLSYSLIVLGVALGGVESVFSSSFYPVLSSIIGLVIGIIIGYVMFYAGQWGGGDSKLIMGLGALFGFSIFNGFSLFNLPLFLIFLINTIFIGAFYGLIWAVIMIFQKWKEFYKEASIHLKAPLTTKLRKAMLVLVSLCIILSIIITPTFFRIVFVVVAIIIFSMFYIWIIVTAIEKACMIKKVSVSKLTEGDWIAKEVKIKNKIVVGPKDLGISKEQIASLKRLKIKEVIVKEGIPFVPSFFIAYLVTLFLGNWFLLLV